METIDRKSLIESILAWDPTRHRGILEGLDEATLKDILAQVVMEFQDQQQDKLDSIQADRQIEQTLHKLRQRQADEPRRQAEAVELERKNKQVFQVAARELGFATIDANYSILVQELKELSVFGIRQFIYEYGKSGGLGLVPATEVELQQWQQEAQAQRQDYLINKASPIELREAAKVEAEQRRVQAQREHVQQQIQSREAIDATQGYPVLPAVNQTTGERLDAAYFIRLSNTDMQLYKNFMRRYGASQITKALNERI